MGDNGAGKSTLVKMIAGNFRPSHGTMRMDGTELVLHRPVDARRHGIEIVHQDLALCDNLTAAANVFLGRELRIGMGPFGVLDYASMYKRAGQIFAELKSETRPRDLVKQMSGGQRQAVAIARTRLSDAKIVLMDEPTAAISVRQVAEVLNLIRLLRDQGLAIVLISHRMPDVFSVADRVIVMRRGRKVADKKIAASSPEEVTGLITGAIERRFDMATTLDQTIAQRQHSRFSAITGSQTFWVLISVLLACAFLSFATESFDTQKNLYNITRNVTFVAIIALGMTLVIITGGIDLSVGSVLCLCSMVLAVTMNAGYSIEIGIAASLGTAIAIGLFNGILIAYLGFPPFVVTLGMLSIARSLAMVASNNTVVFQFGPDHDLLLALGGGAWELIAGIAHRLPRALHDRVRAADRLRPALDQVRPPRLRNRRQRACGDPDRRPGPPDQGRGLCDLGPVGGRRRHHPDRLAWRRHDQHRRRHGTPGHRRRRHRRGQPGRRHRHGVRRPGRRRLDRGDPQQPRPPGHQRVLAGHFHRRRHHPGGAVRPHPQPPPERIVPVDRRGKQARKPRW